MNDFESEFKKDVPLRSERRSSEPIESMGSGSIRVIVNGSPRSLDGAPDLTVRDALETLGFKGQHFAVALNLEFVPRSRYGETRLSDGDAIEVLSPMQGG